MLASLHQLSRDGRSWIAAEAAFAQAEVASDGRRVLTILALAAVAFGCLFAALVLIALFAVAILAPHVGGLANAAALLSLGLITIAASLGWSIWHLASREFGLASVARRWWSFAAGQPESENDAR